MKIKYVFLSMLACGMLAACSNDEVAEGSNTTNLDGGEAYIKVRIAMSDGAASRATSDGYDYGIESEQAIQNIQFAFYDNEGDWVADGIRQGVTNVEGAEDPASGEDEEYVEGIAEAVLALILDEGVEKPTKVIAYVNVPAGFSTSGRSIDQMKELMAESGVSVSTNNNFIMTNSTYYKNGEVIATDVASNKFKDSEGEALADNAPVEIYVERLAAKVKVESKDLASNTSNIESGGYTLSFKVKGFALNATNNKEYYLKNLDGSWNATTPWNGWNDDSDFRCFWSKDPNYDSAPVAGDLTFIGFDEVTKLKENENSYTGYCKENTLTNARYTTSDNHFKECTHALIVGHYELTDNDNPTAGVIKGDDNNPITFYMYRNTAYLEDDLMNIIANMGLVYTKTGTTTEGDEYTTAGADAYKLVQTTPDATIDNNEITAALDWETGSPTTYYIKKEGEQDTYVEVDATNLETVNKSIAEAVGTAEQYTRGMGYYAVPIEHLAASGDGKYGVVRNHSYVLTIESITGLADGVYDPDKDIIPTPPVNKYYVGATLNILSWHTVNQSVNL